MAFVADKVISGEFLPEFRGPPASYRSTGTSYCTTGQPGATVPRYVTVHLTELLPQTNEGDPPALNTNQRN